MDRKQYTKEEVAKNNGSGEDKKTWIIISGTVYDVTDYLEQHPGGSDLINEHAGGDATAGFEDYSHSSDAKKTLKKYEIGFVDESKKDKSRRADNKSEEENSKNVENTQGQNVKQRRKFLRIILGPCASS
ncbi:hypothetical protein QAD02_011246 [Eretmocerus hayati]|uniref:Uncharacterized protein n=1 Tax=Eretmocerus hayati TaxID=131215 RepID=A0ACC2NVY8_9HYME|nr:hypothetical protein QAD02_011246 [Eretmocerus hayati]